MSINILNLTLTIKHHTKVYCVGVGIFYLIASVFLMASCGIHGDTSHHVFSKRKHLKGHYFYGLKRFHPPSEKLKYKETVIESTRPLAIDSLPLPVPTQNRGLSYHYIADTTVSSQGYPELYSGAISSSDSEQISFVDTLSVKDQIHELEKKKKVLTNVGIALIIVGGIFYAVLNFTAPMWTSLILLLGAVVILLIFTSVNKLSKKINQLRNVLYPESKPMDAPNDIKEKPKKKRTYINKAVFIPILSLLLLASLVLSGYIIYELTGLGDGVVDVFSSLFLIIALGGSIILNMLFLIGLLAILFHKNPEKGSKNQT